MNSAYTKKDLRKQLVMTLREALDLARSINAMEREGTDEQDTSFSIGWFIKEALLLLDDSEFLQFHWFKNFILKEISARKPTYSSDELSQVTFNTMEEAREYITGSLGEHASEYDIDAILNHCIGLSYGYGALKIKGHGYDYWSMIEEYKV